MRAALDLAHIAEKEGDVPIGAVIVDHKTNSIVSKGYNRSNIDKNPTLHAEIICIQEACQKLGSKILKDCDIYVTLEPCSMCATAISLAQISRVYYGAYDQKFGAIENGVRLFNSSSTLFIPEVYGGIMEEESIQLLQKFFSNKRST